MERGVRLGVEPRMSDENPRIRCLTLKLEAALVDGSTVEGSEEFYPTIYDIEDARVFTHLDAAASMRTRTNGWAWEELIMAMLLEKMRKHVREGYHPDDKSLDALDRAFERLKLNLRTGSLVRPAV